MSCDIAEAYGNNTIANVCPKQPKGSPLFLFGGNFFWPGSVLPLQKVKTMHTDPTAISRQNIKGSDQRCGKQFPHHSNNHRTAGTQAVVLNGWHQYF